MTDNSGFKVRLAVLIMILFTVTGMFAYEWMVMVPRGKEIVEKLVDLSQKSKDLANKNEVLKVVGAKPLRVTPVEGTDIEIEEYRLPRMLPFASTNRVWVVYQGGNVFKVSTEEQTPDNVKPKIVRQEFDPNNIPFVLGGMGRPPQSQKDEDNNEGQVEKNEGDATEGHTEEGVEKKDDGEGAKQESGEPENKDDGEKANQEADQSEKKDDGEGAKQESGDPENKDDGGGDKEEGDGGGAR